MELFRAASVGMRKYLIYAYTRFFFITGPRILTCFQRCSNTEDVVLWLYGFIDKGRMDIILSILVRQSIMKKNIRDTGTL